MTASEERVERSYPLQVALRASGALRAAAGLEPELFPLSSVAGMLGDEIQALREAGKSDDDIAGIIRANAEIEVAGADIAEHDAPPDLRHPR